MLVVLNMADIARSRGLSINTDALSEALGCGVVMTNARTGEGIDEVRIGIREARIPAPAAPVPGTDSGLRDWAIDLFSRATTRTGTLCPKCGHDLGKPRADGQPAAGATRCPECGFNLDVDIPETRSDRVDRWLLNPVTGLLIFAAVMTGLFYSLFVLASFPMDWIDGIFGWAAALIEARLPDGVLRDLLANGIVAGVGATVIFLPQICLLFFLISLLEDTGYLARGAFLMDRLLRPFGLPGHAFVPLLSSHACALPGIMATRAIPDPKERLATILVAPFMTCSARLP